MTDKINKQLIEFEKQLNNHQDRINTIREALEMNTLKAEPLDLIEVRA